MIDKLREEDLEEASEALKKYKKSQSLKNRFRGYMQKREARISKKHSARLAKMEAKAEKIHQDYRVHKKLEDAEQKMHKLQRMKSKRRQQSWGGVGQVGKQATQSIRSGFGGGDQLFGSRRTVFKGMGTGSSLGSMFGGTPFSGLSGGSAPRREEHARVVQRPSKKKKQKVFQDSSIQDVI